MESFRYKLLSCHRYDITLLGAQKKKEKNEKCWYIHK